MLQVRLVPVSQAGAGAWLVYVSNDAGAIIAVQRQSNPGAVPVYVGPRSFGAVPMNFGGGIPDIPVTPPVQIDTRATDLGDDRVTSDGDTRALS